MNLYVRKLTVTDHVLSAIESTLLKTPANYPYQEEITKTILATAGQRSWQQEDIFAREPMRQIIIIKVWIGASYLETERFTNSKYTN